MDKVLFIISLFRRRESISLHLLVIIILFHISRAPIILNLSSILLIFNVLILISIIFKLSKNTFSHLIYFTYLFLIIEFLLSLKFRSESAIDRDNIYHSFYDTRYVNSYKTSPPNLNITFKSEEFLYFGKTNNLGFTDKNWEKKNLENRYRIFCLGDSFTEGDGAHIDSSYIKFLESKLREQSYHVEVFNAGKRDSDPFFNFKSLKDIIVDYKPNMILQSFSKFDFYQDIYTRGGIERFQEDGSVKYRKNLWWEPLYASSYIIRTFIRIFGYNQFLIKKSEQQFTLEDSKVKTIQLFEDYKNFCDSNNIQLIVFTFPLVKDLMYNEGNNSFYSEFVDNLLNLNIQFYNLQDCYEEKINSNKLKFQDYYWPNDGHHNAQGYEMMAECIDDVIKPILDSVYQTK